MSAPNVRLHSLLLLLLSAQLPAQTADSVWRPRLNTSWQWQLTQPVDLAVDAEMYDIDLFQNSADVVASLHARGRKAVCYVSVGTFEPWRPDASRFPESVKGLALGDFPDERWLDIRRWDLLGPILEARFDICRQKGFDAVEPDNVDAYTNKSGFPLTYQDQIQFNVNIARAAHARGLSVGLKNDLDQIPDLVAHFDWALNEQCFQYKECGTLLPFVQAGKAVFTVEYKGLPESFCPQANSMNFNTLRKNLDLDVYRVACRAAVAPPAGSGVVVNAVVNSASYQGGGVAPGEIVSLFGSGLGPDGGAGGRFTADGLVATEIEQTRVLFDGIAAPLLYAGASQITAVVPYGISGKTRTQVVVERGTARSAELAVEGLGAAPGIFTADASGRGQAAMFNQDGIRNAAARRAPRNSVVTLFATGEGLVTPVPRDGQLSISPYPAPVLEVRVRIGGQSADVLYAGAAPSLVAGAMQLNVRVPANAAEGESVPVAITVGTRESQPGVTMAVGSN